MSYWSFPFGFVMPAMIAVHSPCTSAASGPSVGAGGSVTPSATVVPGDPVKVSICVTPSDS